jgi:REP element-mobilizing transposase RayT
MRHKLTRLDEIYPGYSIFFITFCTHKQQTLLANSSVHDSFRRFSISAEERNTLVGRYVIMPDHIHFFVHFGDAMQISIWMKSLKNSLSKTLRSLGDPAPHWQKGYFDHLVRSEQSYEEKWIYVEQNPVRKELVGEAYLWPYQGEVAPLPFD